MSTFASHNCSTFIIAVSGCFVSKSQPYSDAKSHINVLFHMYNVHVMFLSFSNVLTVVVKNVFVQEKCHFRQG